MASPEESQECLRYFWDFPLKDLSVKMQIHLCQNNLWKRVAFDKFLLLKLLSKKILQSSF